MFDNNGEITPLTQKVISRDRGTLGAARGRRHVFWRRGRSDRDAMPNDDCIVADEHLLDDETDDALPFQDVERVGRVTQSCEECRERLGQAQEHGAVAGLIGDGLQLGAHDLLPLAQRGHALAQLLERQQLFLVGVENALYAVSNTSQFSLQTLLALFRGIGCASRNQTSLEFLLDQGRVLKQSDHFRPDDLIEQILADVASIVAHRTAQFSPAIGANAFVVVNLPRARLRGGARESITTLLAADQALHDARRNRSAPRTYSVLVKELLGSREALLAHQRGYRNLDPLLARPLVADRVAGHHSSAPTQRSGDTLAAGNASLAERGGAAICGITQHGPHHRALPARALLAGWDTLGVQPTRDLPNTEPTDGVQLVNTLNDLGFRVDHPIRGESVIGLADIQVPVWRPAQHADFTGSGPMPFAAPRALQDLRSFVLGDHALELYEQLIFRRDTLGCVHKACLDSLSGQLLDQQNLVGVFATQSVRRVDEDGLDLPLGSEVSYAFEAGTFQCRSAIAFVFEYPLLRDLQIVFLRELEQRCCLARYRAFLALLVRGHSSVDRRQLHKCSPLHVRRQGVAVRVPRARRPARASGRVVDQTYSRDGLGRPDVVDVSQPCLRRALRNAPRARVTISPRVRPLLAAYERNRRTVLGGSFRVIGIEASSTGTGWPRSAARSRYR